MELAVKDVLFLLKGNLYSQVDGIGMGNPLGPTLANTFLCHHEKNWLKDCPPHFQPILYRRYVDDTFLLLRDLSHIGYNFFWTTSILNILIFRLLLCISWPGKHCFSLITFQWNVGSPWNLYKHFFRPWSNF